MTIREEDSPAIVMPECRRFVEKRVTALTNWLGGALGSARSMATLNN